jgi:hypothetical protein
LQQAGAEQLGAQEPQAGAAQLGAHVSQGAAQLGAAQLGAEQQLCALWQRDLQQRRASTVSIEATANTATARAKLISIFMV